MFLIVKYSIGDYYEIYYEIKTTGTQTNKNETY